MSDLYDKNWEELEKELQKYEDTCDLGDDFLFFEGWTACKNEVLKILKENWTGLDLSINSCDEYYIKKIEEI